MGEEKAEETIYTLTRRRNEKEVIVPGREGGGAVKERRREAPTATLSQQSSQRVTVRRADRTPPKVTNASPSKTHTAGRGGDCLPVRLGGDAGNTPLAGSPIVSVSLSASETHFWEESGTRGRSRRTKALETCSLSKVLKPDWAALRGQKKA